MNKQYIRIAIYSSIGLILILGPLYVYRMYTRNAVDVLAQNKKMINVLIEGSNAYHDNRHSFYAILSVNPDNNRIGITFIPPNFRIGLDYSGKNVKRIDEIDTDNFSKISKSLSRTLKINVPFYIELYAADVERFVDLIEGIEIFVLDQAKEIEGIKTGINYLDGSKVIQYINSVENNSIYKKYDRIQDILFTLYTGRERYRSYMNIRFVSEALKRFNTNMLDNEIMSLLKLMDSDSELVCTLLPGRVDNANYYVTDDIACKLYEKEFLARLVIEDNSDTSIKVKIQNGTNVPGLARKMRNILIREGLNVVEFGTSPYQDLEHTIIINQKGDLKGVRTISEIIGASRIYHIIDSSQLNNALIIIGKDYVK